MKTWKKAILAVAGVVVSAAVAVVVAGGWWAWRNTTWNSRVDDRIASAGMVEHEAVVDGLLLVYGESTRKDDLPALVLLHGQGGTWRSYHPVFDELSQHFHVYAVDVPGHGGSDRWRGHYTAVEIGDLIAAFTRDVVGTPAYISGHSSGGHIAATMGAQHPEMVRGVLFKDPPFYSTELPRARETWNWQDLATAADGFIDSSEGEKGTTFQAYYWPRQRMWKYFGDSAQRIIDDGIRYQEKHPGEPITLWYLPGAMAEYDRYTLDYDPYFGQAFYDGSWNAGFDQDATLAAINDSGIPVTYVHATATTGEDGILQAAASDAEAARAMEAMPDATFIEADTSHNYHGDAPGQFVDLIVALLER